MIYFDFMRSVAISVVLVLLSVSIGTGCASCLEAPSQTHHCCNPSGCKAPKAPASAACSSPAPVFGATERRVAPPTTLTFSGPVATAAPIIVAEAQARVEVSRAEYSPPSLYILNSVLNI